MGLLDEAIKEHLDLRRRHGADPEEVAREEFDAFAPVERDEGPEFSSLSADISPEDEASGDGARRRAPLDGYRERITSGRIATDGEELSRSRDASFMEETAEIDMRTVLSELEDAMSGDGAANDLQLRPSVRPERAAPIAASRSRSASDLALDEDPPPWEASAPRVRRIERRASERAASWENSPETWGP